MRRRVENLTPFSFQSDFSSPAEEASTDTITLSTEELNVLISETRAATAELVKNDALQIEADRLADISQQLKLALARVVELTHHLETASLDEHDRQTALESVRRLAGSLIAGQQDLFDKS